MISIPTRAGPLSQVSRLADIEVPAAVLGGTATEPSGAAGLVVADPLVMW